MFPFPADYREARGVHRAAPHPTEDDEEGEQAEAEDAHLPPRCLSRRYERHDVRPVHMRADGKCFGHWRF